LSRGWAGVLVVLAALPAIAPRGMLVSLMELAVVVAWLAKTTAYGEPIILWQLVAIASAMYLAHTSAALAAVLPYDTVVSAGILVAWLVRAGNVVLATVGFSLVVVYGVPLVGNRAYLIASIAGIAIMAALAWVLAMLRRGD